MALAETRSFTVWNVYLYVQAACWETLRAKLRGHSICGAASSQCQLYQRYPCLNL